MLSRKKESLAAILAGIVLVGYIAFLLVANYLSQAELRESTLKRVVQDMENRAAAVSYFSFERVNDLKGLAAGKELAYFFVNKALGMSMKYGLSANLQDIAASFERLIDQKKLGSNPIYDRIDFIGLDANIHINRATVNAPDVDATELKKIIDSEISDVRITHLTHSGVPRMVLSVPYVFKGDYVGQIITWVGIGTVYRDLIQVGEEDSGRAFYIVHGNEYLPLPAEVNTRMDASDLPECATIPEKKYIGLRREGQMESVRTCWRSRFRCRTPRFCSWLSCLRVSSLDRRGFGGFFCFWEGCPSLWYSASAPC
ncbi:MAG: hypothetical protein JSW39_02405 [Desulfobacterales bacterium]|nr:MAG: hypothetical protein JSW39_02405 [Desulfobacterales bacterium]